MAEARLVVDEGEGVALQGGFPGSGLGVRRGRVVGFDVPDQAEGAVRLEDAVEGLEDVGGGKPMEGLEAGGKKEVLVGVFFGRNWLVGGGN